ncbi:electron transfer flavoprotein subunit beta/FixA family protein [Wenyingzhuangia aestuarii]|uniref:electron transfer flavoprotein subunit beta/FixA family protein n=1 Tax=Wenyingzhuangia aestuarii TaxID=1647582 RepID=UPI001438C6CC|nr:electron transfer flavoprotein subunit beta/FixA family protein [Wenyingzhuangia aestuarii]NJB83218.1 electron transfer flavoprotein beta subunit [Wenyingzhuangia aestuarii]
MKILVCISHVPDTTSKINFTGDSTEFDTNGVQFVINPYDEFALTRAIWFQEKQGATVTVVNVGDATTEPTLRKALAIGADAAIRIDAKPTDGYFVAQQLAELYKKENYDLVLMGKESIDYNGAMVPGLLASFLDIDYINACIGLEVEGTNAQASREIDGGVEKVSATLPIIVAGQKGLVEEKDLKIPNMRGIMMARKKPLTVMPATDASATTEINSFEKPAEKGACKMIDASNVDELINLLHNEAKVI